MRMAKQWWGLLLTLGTCTAPFHSERAPDGAATDATTHVQVVDIQAGTSGSATSWGETLAGRMDNISVLNFAGSNSPVPFPGQDDNGNDLCPEVMP